MAHIYIFLTLIFAIYGQLIIKWQVSLAGELPIDFSEKIFFLVKILINPWVISSMICTFLAALTWMAALTKFPLSYAYLFMSMVFVFVPILSAIFFNESITTPKMLAMLLIVTGVILGSRG